MKPQGVRLVDVFLLGPFMVWVGARPGALPEWARALMVVSGAGTIVYNGANYLANQEQKAFKR